MSDRGWRSILYPAGCRTVDLRRSQTTGGQRIIKLVMQNSKTRNTIVLVRLRAIFSSMRKGERLPDNEQENPRVQLPIASSKPCHGRHSAQLSVLFNEDTRLARSRPMRIGFSSTEKEGHRGNDALLHR